MVEKVDQVEKSNIFTRVSIFQRGRENAIKLILFTGSLVAILTYIYFAFLKVDNHTVQYSPEEIVYDQPLRAVHAMNAVSAAAVLNLTPGNSSSIPKFVLSENYFDFGIVDSNSENLLGVALEVDIDPVGLALLNPLAFFLYC